jgi:hypothetical protein
VYPPSTDNAISTALQLTYGALVPAASHVTGTLAPVFQTIDVFGFVTRKGPTESETTTLTWL